MYAITQSNCALLEDDMLQPLNIE